MICGDDRMEYTYLKNVCNIIMGQSPDSSSYNAEGDGVPFFQGNADFGDLYPKVRVWSNEPKKMAKASDILISVRAPIGALNYAKEECCIGRGLAAIEPLKLVNSKYIYYLLKSKNSELNSKGTGSTFKAIGKSVLEAVKVPVMEKLQQDIIVDRIEKVEGIIRNCKKQLNLLDMLIKSRFVEMFGNPLDSNRVNYIFTECVEFNPKKSEVKDIQDVEVSFVPMECVGVDGSFAIKGTGLISEYYSGYTYFRDGDVLLAKITPCFENGKVAIAADCMNGIGFGTTEFHVSRPLKGITNSIWIKYLLKNDMVHDLATINMSGSAGQKRIQTPFFNKLKVYVPPIEEQELFADFVKQVDKLKSELQNIIQNTRINTTQLQNKRGRLLCQILNFYKIKKNTHYFLMLP